MNSRTLLINSKDRDTGSTHDFSYKLDGFIHGVKGIIVDDIQLYNTQYTINSNNNKLYWTDNTSASKISTLTSQSYTLNELCIEISNKLNADATSGTYLCSFNLSTYKVTISSSTGNIGLTFGTNTTNSVAYTIGFDNTDLSAAASHTGTNIPRLNTKYYEIQSDLVVDTTNNNLGNRNTLTILRNNKLFGDLLDHNLYLGKSLKTYKNSLDKIRFSVYNDQGQLANLNGVDWSIQITLMIE